MNIGIDLGGSHIGVGLVEKDKILKRLNEKLSSTTFCKTKCYRE